MRMQLDYQVPANLPSNEVTSENRYLCPQSTRRTGKTKVSATGIPGADFSLTCYDSNSPNTCLREVPVPVQGHEQHATQQKYRYSSMLDPMRNSVVFNENSKIVLRLLACASHRHWVLNTRERMNLSLPLSLPLSHTHTHIPRQARTTRQGSTESDGTARGRDPTLP